MYSEINKKIKTLKTLSCAIVGTHTAFGGVLLRILALTGEEENLYNVLHLFVPFCFLEFCWARIGGTPSPNYSLPLRPRPGLDRGELNQSVIHLWGKGRNSAYQSGELRSTDETNPTVLPKSCRSYFWITDCCRERESRWLPYSARSELAIAIHSPQQSLCGMRRWAGKLNKTWVKLRGQALHLSCQLLSAIEPNASLTIGLYV